MARSRLEILEEEEAQSQAERNRFEELADQYRQQGHLPPGGDQSWREREAMRRAAYDKGYTPPPGDPSWREREAAARAPSHEPAQEPVQESVHAEFTADRMAEEQYAPQERGLEPVHVAKSGQGGTVLIFILVAAIALGVAALAYPEMLTAAYWRTAGSQTNSVPQTPPPAVEPAAPAAQPAPLRAEPPAPALNAAPQPSAPPPSAPAPDASAAPVPVAPAEEAPSPPATETAPAPNVNPIEAPKPKLRPRASARDVRGTSGVVDRGAGGFYAKVPGPGGVMEYKYFSANPDSDSSAAAPAQKEPAVPDTGGFYSRALGPDGTMQYRYFPRQPPPPR